MAMNFSRSTFVGMLLLALAIATYPMTAVAAEILNKNTSDGCSIPNPPLGIKVPECVAALTANFSAYAAWWGSQVVNLGCTTAVSGSLSTVQFTTVTCQMSPFPAGPFGSAWSSYQACPANSIDQGETCLCNAGTFADQPNYACVPIPEQKCPIPALTNPPFQDACSQALESANSSQAQKEAACGTITPAMASAQQCLSNAITAKGIPFKVTSQVRGLEYQAHFKEIWDKMEAVAKLMADDSAMQTACAARRAEIAAEKGCDNAGPCVTCTASGRNHCLKQGPAKPTSAAQHANRNAIDVSAAQTIKPLQTYLNGLRPPQNIAQFIAAQNCPITCATAPPTAGSLLWGGTFKAKDPVHFTTTCP